MEPLKLLAREMFYDLRGDLSSGNLLRVLEEQEWSVDTLDSKTLRQFPKKLRDYARRKEAFSYFDDNGAETIRIILICPNLSERRKARLLLHEFVHINLGHLRNSGVYRENNREQEREANRCVRALLMLGALQRMSLVSGRGILARVGVAFVFLCGVAFLISSFVTMHTVKPASVIAQTAATASPPPAVATPTSRPTAATAASGQTIYMTEHGEVYHSLRDCPYIRNKEEDALLTYDLQQVQAVYPLCDYCRRHTP